MRPDKESLIVSYNTNLPWVLILEEEIEASDEGPVVQDIGTILKNFLSRPMIAWQQIYQDLSILTTGGTYCHPTL